VGGPGDTEVGTIKINGGKKIEDEITETWKAGFLRRR